jgi:hypothetical protein
MTRTAGDAASTAVLTGLSGSSPRQCSASSIKKEVSILFRPCHDPLRASLLMQVRQSDCMETLAVLNTKGKAGLTVVASER